MKIAHINGNNQLLGWYDKEIHGTFIEPIYETKTTIINKVETVEKVLVKDGYWDTSKIPTPNIEVNEDVWQNALDNGHNKVNSDGTTEFFDFRTSKEIEAQRVSSIKSKAGQLIEEKYPNYKQLNIIRVAGVELQTMTEYIDKVRSISNEAEENGTKLEDIVWEIL